MSADRASPIMGIEKDYLIHLVREEKILNNRSTDGRIVALKKKAWGKITSKFNAECSGPRRTEPQLRKIWERLKAKAKKDHAIRKREIMKTGGGAPPADLSSGVSEVLEIIGTEINDLGCDFDSDSRRYSGVLTKPKLPSITADDSSVLIFPSTSNYSEIGIHSSSPEPFSFANTSSEFVEYIEDLEPSSNRSQSQVFDIKTSPGHSSSRSKCPGYNFKKTSPVPSFSRSHSPTYDAKRSTPISSSSRSASPVSFAVPFSSRESDDIPLQGSCYENAPSTSMQKSKKGKSRKFDDFTTATIRNFTLEEHDFKRKLWEAQQKVLELQEEEAELRRKNEQLNLQLLENKFLTSQHELEHSQNNLLKDDFEIELLKLKVKKMKSKDE